MKAQSWGIGPVFKILCGTGKIHHHIDKVGSSIAGLLSGDLVTISELGGGEDISELGFG